MGALDTGKILLLQNCLELFYSGRLPPFQSTCIVSHTHTQRAREASPSIYALSRYTAKTNRSQQCTRPR